jgi:hypothetical protein
MMRNQEMINLRWRSKNFTMHTFDRGMMFSIITFDTP